MNRKIVQIEQDIINVINNSGVNVAIINLILTKVQREAAILLQQEIQKEEQAEAEQETTQVEAEEIITE